MNPDRDEAARSDTALARYHTTWERALARLQRAHPVRWSVRGWSPDEVRAELTLRLIEVVRGPREDQARYEWPDKPWALVVMRARLAELRKTHRLREEVGEVDVPTLLNPPATQEEHCLDAEAAALHAAARAAAEAALSRPQRRWYAAMRLAANAGAFFEASDALNLSAAARLLDKNRSSAQRAYAELQSLFGRELRARADREPPPGGRRAR